ncbi:U6 small nuclear RNA (adenine-(43)-N(6))-methyltransferase-like [Papaver somniferum]|uniref:U6 small nuclear RNA (adenine-(43)-N(6))-methyltransferase-like n=1 Tax=Papaver somniferum TaxID=3469 RepID=UPI000E6FD043|nr:U6 small nuclear RNA (adenine-(43)-N(6))-methyltransferase-like [Papaver somniferum]
MPSKKRRREEKASIHPRNKYSENPPDFQQLASLYPSFQPFVFYSPRDGRPRIDWTDFNATRELTRVLLFHDHGVHWWIPDGQLCPTIPNRSNYIHWIEDLLSSDVIAKTNVSGDNKVRGFDIGTGANCIYPLLGASLLGWNFVGSDVTDVALEWAEYNVKSNPHLSELIEIRRAGSAGKKNTPHEAADANGQLATETERCSEQVIGDEIESVAKASDLVSDSQEAAAAANGQLASETERCSEQVIGDETESVDKVSDVVSDSQEATAANGQLATERERCSEEIIREAELEVKVPDVVSELQEKSSDEPRVLLGVVKDGERFDFCMCNPPFFESMEEAGLNPKTACGGTPAEMVCPGGELAFISRIIEDSAVLKQSFRWYTSMVGRKINLKLLTSKLREVGVSVVKTTEFVQGHMCRWGLAWSFIPPATITASHRTPKTSMSFMLEGIQRQISAMHILQSVESFFAAAGASCKSNCSSFVVDVTVSNERCDAIVNNESVNSYETSNSQPRQPTCDDAVPSKEISFRISVFQQIPGTLLVKASLQNKGGPLSGALSVLFQQLELSLKKDYCRNT